MMTFYLTKTIIEYLPYNSIHFLISKLSEKTGHPFPLNNATVLIKDKRYQPELLKLNDMPRIQLVKMVDTNIKYNILYVKSIKYIKYIKYIKLLRLLVLNIK